MAKAGYVDIFSGLYGGYKIACAPRQVTEKDIYLTVGKESITPPTTEATGTETFISLIILKAETEFQNILEQYTLEHIIQHRKI
ncbi:Rrf2 family transcriptional regulator [Solibacillus silvestris]|uniref:Rrf2 family transcriptional regulator n=1 Tax=Solibacillus silvestris TaxID=76853 RepID=UPI003F7DD233